MLNYEYGPLYSRYTYISDHFFLQSHKQILRLRWGRGEMVNLKRDILFRNKRTGKEKSLKLRQDPIFHSKPLNLPKVQ